MIIPLAILPTGEYQRPVLGAPDDAPPGFLLMKGGWRKGNIDLTCGSCARVLAAQLRSTRVARLVIFICPQCGVANALD